MTVEHRFETREQLAQELARDVAAALEEAVAERGRASLVVSGGTTPLPFFHALRTAHLPWERIVVTLADDRWVPVEHERSNEGLVRRELLSDRAAAARFVGLAGATTSATPEAGVAAAEARLAEITKPFDVVVLGMGTDGHTASLFPDAPETAAALGADSTALCSAVTPGGALEPRISLTLAALAAGRRLILHITGEDKWDVYHRATTRETTLPVGAVLRAASGATEVYWAP